MTRPLRSAMAAGILWGVAWGMTLLAPELIRTHAMSGTPDDAVKLILLLAILFAALGAGIAAGIYVIAAAAGRFIAQPPEPRFTLPATIAVFMPAIYIAAGAVIYFWKFRTIGGAGWYERAVVLAITVTIAALASAFIFFALTPRRSQAQKEKILTLLAAATAVITSIVLVLRFPSPDMLAVQAQRLARVEGRQTRAHKLVVIAIDGGTWHVITPLLRQGRLPTFASIIDEGMHGNVDAYWPPYWSVAAWGAITTGHRRRDVGVFGDIEVHIPGLPVFQSPMDLSPRLLPITAVEYALASGRMIRAEVPNRKSLRVPPVWEYLDRSGIPAAVVRWNFSYPAAGQAKVVVSNLAMADVWRIVGVQAPDTNGLLTPASRRHELLSNFASDWKGDSAQFRRIFPRGTWPKPKDATLDPVNMLHDALRFDQATVETVSHLVRSDPEIQAFFVHFGGLDTIEHVFWQYRFPEEFERKPDSADIVALGPVLDRYAEVIDAGIAQVLSSFAERPNVLIVSDHGQAAREDGVPFKGWHASPGIFLAAGPDIARRSDLLNVSYFDIAPTILHLQGLVKPDHMKGRSLLDSGTIITVSGPAPESLPSSSQ